MLRLESVTCGFHLHATLKSKQTSPQKLPVKIARNLGMYKKAKKQVVSNQYFDPSQFVGDQPS